MKIIAKFEMGYEVISMVRLENKSAGLIKKYNIKRLFYKSDKYIIRSGKI